MFCLYTSSKLSRPEFEFSLKVMESNPRYLIKSFLLYRKLNYIEFFSDIFLGHNVRFGLILGQLAVLKKKGADYEQLLMAVFACFHGQKKHYRVRTKKLHNIFFIKQSIVYCSVGETSLRDF
jgi:uncharacterized protein YecE (DUF72 family)